MTVGDAQLVGDSPTPPRTLVVTRWNLSALMELPPRDYEFLRIDVTSGCNLRCLYCEVGRGIGTLSVAEVRELLAGHVAKVQHVFLGCAMEPTLHRELGRHLLTVREVLDPPGDLAIQTNGLLLERHDWQLFRDAGLNLLSLSIDSLQPETMAELRDGTDPAWVLRQMEEMRRVIPDLAVMFSVVVSARNLSEIPELVEYGAAQGVREIWFRELTCDQLDDPPAKRSLLLGPGRFGALRQQLQRYFEQIPLYFLDTRTLRECEGRDNPIE